MISAPGFADPVGGAQVCFRAVLGGMSRPGSLHEAGAGLTPPAPLDLATAAVLLTLVDADTLVWLAPDFSPAREWVAFHCGATVVDDIGQAAFAVAAELPDLVALNTGSDEAPEDAATLVLQLLVEGLPEGFAAKWADNHALFPRGVDIILCAGTTLTALPRSVRIAEG
jgi:alpha-D-ribose 1-methylphosphonate 5-triphosphate synthase subunit PhnH